MLPDSRLHIGVCTIIRRRTETVTRRIPIDPVATTAEETPAAAAEPRVVPYAAKEFTSCWLLPAYRPAIAEAAVAPQLPFQGNTRSPRFTKTCTPG